MLQLLAMAFITKGVTFPTRSLFWLMGNVVLFELKAHLEFDNPLQTKQVLIHLDTNDLGTTASVSDPKLLP